MTDFVVVGAGIIGLSLAWELSRRGRSVVVVDGVESAASGVAAGMLAPLCEAPDLPPVVLKLGLESASMWPGFAAALEAESGVGVGYRAEGTLLVGMDADELAELEQAARVLGKLGLRFEALGPREVRRREGALHPRLAGGFWSPDDHSVDAQAVCAALRAALGRRGVRMSAGMALRVEGECVLGPQGELARGKQVVVAVGARTEALVPSLPVVPVKGQVVVLEGEVLLGSVVRTPRVYLVPRAGGRLVVGASMEEQGFDERPTAGIVMNLLREAYRALPGTFELVLEAVRTGLRPMLRDGVPAWGPTGDVIVVTGHHRHGVLLAPLTARHVVEALVGERTWDPALLPTRPGLAG